MWETPQLTSEERRSAQEVFFGDTSWPKTNDMSQPWPDTDVATTAAREMMKLDDKRPQPFERKTEPYAHLSRDAYDARMNA